MDLKCEHSPEAKPIVCKCTTEELASLRQRIVRLEKALEKYGDHKIPCGFFRPIQIGQVNYPCDCGFKEALSEWQGE